jgi:thymidine kinase
MGIKQKILIINSVLDVRPDINESGNLTSHRDSPSRVRNARQITVKTLKEIPLQLIEQHDVIGIDEAQFFEDITLVFEWLKMGKSIITAGLMFTSECKPFGDYYLLLSHADEVIRLSAVCLKCKEEMDVHHISGMSQQANMTKCLKQKDTDISVDNEYIPVCRYHYYN